MMHYQSGDACDREHFGRADLRAKELKFHVRPSIKYFGRLGLSCHLGKSIAQNSSGVIYTNQFKLSDMHKSAAAIEKNPVASNLPMYQLQYTLKLSGGDFVSGSLSSKVMATVTTQKLSDSL